MLTKSAVILKLVKYVKYIEILVFGNLIIYRNKHCKRQLKNPVSENKGMLSQHHDKETKPTHQ